MSDWNPVTSKKKPPSVETEAPAKRPPTTEDRIDIVSTTRIRVQFSLHSGYKNFNPVMALRGLFTAMKASHPEAVICDVQGSNVYRNPDHLPEEATTFEAGFPVYPHLRRTGGNSVHVHFRITNTVSIVSLKKNPSFLHYLQRNRIWIAQHQFRDGSIASVGFVFMKSPSLTHLENYVTSLRMNLTSPSSTPSTNQQSPENSHRTGDSHESSQASPPSVPCVVIIFLSQYLNSNL